MPISIVVGGQYGSEGKGKVALDLVRRDATITTVVRPGGTNSGHTGYSRCGKQIVLRQLPAAAIDRKVRVVFPAGSYICVDLLLREITQLGLSASQVLIDPRAHLIRREHVEWESEAALTLKIGSTGSGTGAAVISRSARFAPQLPLGITASESNALQPFLADTASAMAEFLQSGERILIEGTQGFGLSVLHSDHWPKCTSRDTTAAGFLSEAGLSPLHVDNVILVIRCHPIRVAGDSGPLVNETSWQRIAAEAGTPSDIREFTSVTHKLRRVGHFEPGLVRKAINANAPTEIVLNHLDYVDWHTRTGQISDVAYEFLRQVERSIGQGISMVGVDERALIDLVPRLVARY